VATGLRPPKSPFDPDTKNVISSFRAFHIAPPPLFTDNKGLHAHSLLSLATELHANKHASQSCEQWLKWRWNRGANCPLGKLNVKTGPTLSLYFGFSILLVLSKLLFFAFFGVISGDLGQEVGNLRPAWKLIWPASEFSLPKLEHDIASNWNFTRSSHVDSHSREVSLTHWRSFLSLFSFGR